MSPKIGRPPKDNPRNINLNIRLTKQESADIQECAEKMKITRTDAIMKGINLLKAELNRQ